MLGSNLFYLSRLHLLPLLLHIQTKTRFQDLNDFHRVLSLNQLFWGILIAMNLFPKLNRLLIPVQSVPFKLKILTLH